MRKRLLIGLLSGALVGAMLPGVAVAAGKLDPQLTPVCETDASGQLVSVEWTGINLPWVYILAKYKVNHGGTMFNYLPSVPNDGGPVDLIGVGRTPGGSWPSLEVWVEFKKKNGQLVASTYIFCPYIPA